MPMLKLEEPDRPTPVGMPILRLGFRPFYLAAAVFALLAVPYWVQQLAGGAALPGVPGVLWHAHEMVYGFAVAVIAGFLLTAVGNWTALPMPRGPRLLALFAVWCCGRLALLVSAGPLAAAIDLAFLPVLALCIARLLWRAKNRRNTFVPVLLLLLALCNLAFHLGRLGVVQMDPTRPLHGALYLITVLETLIAGRILPMFTRNAIPGLQQTFRPWLERIVPAITVAAFAAIAIAPQWLPGAALCLVAGGLHLLRLSGWGSWRTRSLPMLWILHLGYACIGLALTLAAFAVCGFASWVAVYHLLAVGALACLVLGMMMRTALGHTGRMIGAGLAEKTAFGALVCSLLLRIAPLLLPLPGNYIGWMAAAAASWSAAFAIYLVRYLPVLTRPRIDGRDG
ncbi:NnrS family protein [Paludibacterium yongneupense]|uniref:NnrS family protein n=1 Tax=Paludibacterium yongneupense TaxID=400061 RepID=UPI000428A420|nr:NnrS family protein [Paludibacterium yongneupense]